MGKEIRGRGRACAHIGLSNFWLRKSRVVAEVSTHDVNELRGPFRNQVFRWLVLTGCELKLEPFLKKPAC